MIETTTLTQIGLRLQMVCLELQSLNDRSLKDPLLNEIIAFCVPERYLAKFTILGLEGNEIHMRLEVRIDYEEHDQQVTLSGEGLPGGLEGSYSLEYGPSNGSDNSSAQLQHCPHMGKAVDLFMRLARDKNLNLQWTVQFREKREEMCKKFGLGPAIYRDCTGGGAHNELTNSKLSEISITACASTKIVPRE